LSFFRSIANHPRHLLFAVGLLGIALVVGGIVMARTMNLAACPLCILQRMVYLLIAIDAVVAGAFFRKPQVVLMSALVIAATAGLGAFIAGYQTWIQRFAKDVSCTANQPWWESFVYWAGEQVPVLFSATGLCSEAGWKFLSLSIAEWSLAMFLGMTAIAIRAAWLSRG
jgi:protein dithiol:quinone oxidoreductase